MRVIPVIDVLKGKAVQAIRGERQKYQPIKTALAPSSEPTEIALAFQEIYGFSEMYVADLDAIQGVGSNFEVIKKISNSTDLKLIIDAGINNPKDTMRTLEAGAEKVVIATETLDSIKQLEECIKAVGGQKIVGSLDYKEGRILTKSGELMKLKPIQVAEIFEKKGACEIIFLELSKVGTLQGLETGTLKELIQAVRIPVLTGGGIESVREIIGLQNLGIAGVLVATALHKGKIRPDDLQNLS
ncbi:MAG: HisA/HisF-related TIM barrel protein [Candidatus Jordarchaeum sp.]|uniref:HisA/HisF-related TIM barrel protein n=1 Tax=Candidatus Jordarchaeum sp. TaxID=2823881 RepID=UPI004049E90B